MSGHLDIARRVIRIEADALRQLEAGLDRNFVAAVDMILAVTGRVVVSGMGKSGHIGRKIAATLASTGTPAQFVHPAEASHGDLGMISRGDMLLVLSKSGETPEVSDIVAYSRRFGIPLVGIANQGDSTLLRQSDVALTIPSAMEACGIGLAPTSSTTMMLALGDALAITLMECREFTRADFREFHPGGTLGARLSPVRRLMHTMEALPLVSPETPMAETLVEMTKRGFGSAGVCEDEGALIGIITDGDLRRHIDGLLDARARDVMTTDPVTVSADTLAEEAVGIMNARKITCLFVTDPENTRKVVGLIHIHDCLRAGLG